MNKKTQRLMRLFLVCILAVGLLAACTRPTDLTTTEPTAASTAKPTAAATQAPPEEPAVKWSGTISAASYMFAPVDDSLNIVGPYIEEKLLDYGYDVDFDPVYIENTQYQEIMNTRIAGGTAPDIFLSLSKTNMKNYYEQGAIASWTKEFFEENAPNVYNYIVTGGVDGRIINYVDMFWEFSMIDDKMVTIAKFAESSAMLQKAVIYRGDWLENLGVTDMPMTMDEYTDLMYRFVNEDPDQDGAKDTYGMSTSMLRAVFGAYGNYNGFIGSTPQWYVEDGKMVCADLMPENKDALTLLAQYYADGILDPEFITGENTGGYWAISQPFINGVIGVSCLASIDHYRMPEILGDNGGPCTIEYFAINNDYSFQYGPWPAGPDGDYGYAIDYAVTVGESAVYNAALNNDPDKLAAIFGIMDAFAVDDELSMYVQYGEEGVTFAWDDELPKALLDNESMNGYGVWAYRSVYGADCPYNYTVQNYSFYLNKTIKNRLDHQAQEQWDSYYLNALTTSLPSQSTYQDELITYRDETWISIIKGDLSVDYWDTFVEEYMDRGGQILYDEANEWYASK